jgi:hypothetical protein
MDSLNKLSCVYRSENYNDRDSSMSQLVSPNDPASDFHLFATISAHVSNQWAAGSVTRLPERDTNHFAA